ATMLPGTITYQRVAGIPGQDAILSANINTSFAAPGPQTITVSYSGDSNYAPSASSATTIASLYPTTISQSESATTINVGQNITVTATITGNVKSPPMTGQLMFNAGYAEESGYSTTPGTDANGNQILTATATLTLPFTQTVWVTYAGDANYGPASTAGDLITVIIPDFTLGPSGLSVQPVAGQTGSAQITITPVSSNQQPSTVILTLLPVSLPGYTVALDQLSVNLNGSPVTANLTLTPTVSVPSNAIRMRAHHAGFFGVKRGNWWTLSLAAGLSALFLVGVPGRRKRLRAALELGVICALFFALGCGGGGRGGGGGGPVATTVTLTTTNSKVAQNAPFSITATVNSSKPVTGTVSFSNLGFVFAGNVPITNGQATTGAASLTSPGVYQVTATYNGDANNLSSTSDPLIQVITGTIPATIQANTSVNIHTLPVTVGVQ